MMRTNGTIGRFVLVGWCVFVVVGAAAQNLADERRAIQAAENLYFNNEWKQAITALETFIETYPQSEELGRAYLRLGQSYAKLADDARARQAYSKAIQVDPDTPYATQAVSYWATLYAQRYQYREATMMAEEVMRLFPGTRAAEMAHYLLGTYLYADGRREEAARAYRTFLVAYPTSVYHRSAFRQLVSILMELGKGDEAESLLDEFLTDAPNDTLFIEQLAQVYQRQERYDDAIRLLTKALERRPNDTTLLETLGEVYAVKGERDRALTTWMRIVATQEASYNTHQRLGSLLKQNGFYKEAAAQYEAAIRLQPSYAYLYTQLAEIYTIQGDLDKALDVYVGALANLGLSYGNRQPILDAIRELYPPNRAAKAFADAAEAVRQRFGPNLESNATAVLTMAEMSFMQGDWDASLAWFEKLARLYPDRGQLLAQYAQRLSEQDRDADALRLYRAAVRLFPNAPETPGRLEAIGEHLERLDRPQEALAAYRQAIERDPSRRIARNADVRLVDLLVHALHRPQEALDHLASIRGRPIYTWVRAEFDRLTAEAYLALGDIATARGLLERIAAPEPSTAARVQYLLAETYLYENDFERAEALYLEVARAHPDAEAANDALARVALLRANEGVPEALKVYVAALAARDRGDLETAIRTCEEAIRLAPEAPVADDARLLLGELATRQGDIAKAVDAYEAIVETGGQLAAEALLRLGALHGERGDPNAALNAYERLLERFPSGAYAVTARGRLRTLLDNGTEDIR